MNLILFDPEELDRPLPRRDPRAVHLLDVLRCTPGACFDMGVCDGPRGRARLLAVEADALALEFELEDEQPTLHPVTLLVGLPRPQVARRILREVTTLGVAAMIFARTEKGDPGYHQSKLWTDPEYPRHLRLGAEQAFCTRLPAVTLADSLAAALGGLEPGADRLALDNYEAAHGLATWSPRVAETLLAVGGERGWSNRERDLLRAHGFTLAHLGPRVLKTETACVSGLTLVLARRGLL